MSKDLLLEIGTEEVPAHAMPGILAELKEKKPEVMVDFTPVSPPLSINEVSLLTT